MNLLKHPSELKTGSNKKYIYIYVYMYNTYQHLSMWIVYLHNDICFENYEIRVYDPTFYKTFGKFYI